MVRRLCLAASLLALEGCFDFGADLARCRAEGRCPLSDGGFIDGGRSDAGTVFSAPGGLCAQGVCWENPFPVSVPLVAAYAPSRDEVFLGGGSGVVVHFSAAAPEIFYLGRPVAPDTNWFSIAGLAGCSTGVSAVTGDRQRFTLTNGSFESTPIVGQWTQPRVAQGWTGPGPTCAFVGNNGSAVWAAEERAGTLVTLDSPPSTQPYWRDMVALGGTSTNDLWFASTTDVQPHSDDGGIGPDTVPLPDGGLPGVTGVCSLGGGKVFVSTSDGVWARSTTGWSRLSASRSLNDITCLPSGEVIAVGDGVIETCPGGGGCVELTGPEVWRTIVPWGEQALLGSKAGVVASLSNGVLSRLSSGVRTDLADLSIAPNGDAWSAGKGATLLHRVDGGWSPVDAGVSPGEDLLAVAVLSDGRVVTGGTGGVLRVLKPDGGIDKPMLIKNDGTLIMNQRLGQDLRRFREGRGSVWAVGTAGTLLHEEPDGRWRLVLSGIDDGYDLAFNDAGVAWITGEGAGVTQVEVDGHASLIRGPFTSYAFFTAFVDRQGTVWFAGRNGLAMRLNPDGGQEPFNFPGRNDDIVGFVEQPDSLYAVGQHSLYRFASSQPIQWEIIGPLPLDPKTNAPQAVAAFGEDFWVVGKNGAIVRVNRTAWLHSP